MGVWSLIELKLLLYEKHIYKIWNSVTQAVNKYLKIFPFTPIRNETSTKFTQFTVLSSITGKMIPYYIKNVQIRSRGYKFWVHALLNACFLFGLNKTENSKKFHFLLLNWKVTSEKNYKVKYMYCIWFIICKFETSCHENIFITSEPETAIKIWAKSRENLFMPNANNKHNKGADQPARLRSLISAFVVRCLKSIIPLLAISEMPRP